MDATDWCMLVYAVGFVAMVLHGVHRYHRSRHLTTDPRDRTPGYTTPTRLEMWGDIFFCAAIWPIVLLVVCALSAERDDSDIVEM